MVTPKANEKCLCGSNLKYKKCCAPVLPKSIGDMHKKFIECWKGNNFQGMLRAARADVTKYTICHRSHTVVALNSGLEYAPHLFEIDIDALADYVDFLMRAYEKLGRLKEFSVVLERLRHNISSPRWNQKIIYFQTLSTLGPEWDIDSGLVEIRKLGPIIDVHDPEVLALYLDLIRNELSLDENLRLIERVRANSELFTTQIHQGIIKANLLFCHNDIKGTVNALDEIIKSLEEEEDDLDVFLRDKYAQCLYFLATLGIDSTIESNVKKASEFLKRSEQQFRALLATDGFTTRGLANLHRGLADCLRIQDKWDEAILEYQKAYELDHREIHRVFEAECLYENGRIFDALELIDKIDLEGLEDDASKNDYVVRYSRMSINEGDFDRLSIAKDLLTTPLILVPVFKQQHQRTLIQVLKAIEEVKKNPAKARKRVSLGLSKLNAYFILQPTFFGFGVNINKIIEDRTKKSKEHKLLENDDMKQND